MGELSCYYGRAFLNLSGVAEQLWYLVVPGNWYGLAAKRDAQVFLLLHPASRHGIYLEQVLKRREKGYSNSKVTHASSVSCGNPVVTKAQGEPWILDL